MAKCAEGCTCRRHKDRGTTRPFKARPKCADDCACGKHVRSPESAAATGLALRGVPKSPEHRAKLSKAKQGQPLTAEHRENISQGLARRIPWDKKSVASKHIWARRYLVKAPGCEHCGGSDRMEWASINHVYTKNRDEWKWLCRACHRKMDWGLLESTEGGGLA